MLSVILICKNEAEMIRDCLESLRGLADEIIILDSGSTDRTLDIAREYTAHVYLTDWPGFGVQRNRALGYVTGDWVLSIDADERVTPESAEEIKSVINHGPIKQGAINCAPTAYYVPFEPYFLGKKIKFGDWRNDYKLRLFKKDSWKFDDAPVHENLISSGSSGVIGKLKNSMLHFSYSNQNQIDQKVMFYARAGAEKLRQKGKTGGLYIGLLKGGFAFVRGYLIKLGFLDGMAGFKLAKMNARYTFWRYFWVK